MKFQLGDTVRLADSLFFDPEARGKYGRITRIVKRNGEEPKYTIGDIAGFSCTQEALDEYIELVDRPRANTPPSSVSCSFGNFPRTQLDILPFSGLPIPILSL